MNNKYDHYPPKTEYTSSRYILTRIKNHFQHQINVGLLLIGEDYFNYVTNDIILNIQTQLFGENKKDSVEVEFKYPSNIWQHIKLELCPKFILKMFPVKYKTEIKVVDLHRDWLFPNCYIKSNNNPMLDHFIIQDHHQIK